MNPYVEAGFDFLKAIAPSLITVLLGAFVVQKFFVSRANEAALVDFLIKELEELRNDALEYWNLVADSKEDRERQAMVAQKIKGNLKALSADLRFYCERYSRKHEAHFSKLVTNLHDTCTGGDFESQRKKPDSQRYIIVVNAINGIKSDLLRQKL